jgi:carboxyl-terminal processing protease
MRTYRLFVYIFVCLLIPLVYPENQRPASHIVDADYDIIVFDWSRTLAQVLHLVKEKHYKITVPDQAFAKAIDAFLSYLDPHSNFLDQKTYRHMLETTSGEFHGTGLVIDNTRKRKDRFLTIVDILPAGPADKAGIMQYDKIVEVDGKPLEGMTTEEAISQLKGPKGTKVSIKILREGSTDLLSFTLTRDTIKEQISMSFFIKNFNVCYLSLSMFTDNAATMLENLLNQASEHKYRSLILDVRNNSGGLLSSVIDIVSLFVQKGSTVVTTKDKNNKEIERYITAREPIKTNTVPMFVLINNFTASAAEILAGCLKIHAEQNNNNHLVFLVGGTTFGKGSVQEVIPISNNGAIKITTSLYFLPDNTTIQGIGITPDFPVERCLPATEQSRWFLKHYGHENNLDRYIQVTPEIESLSSADRGASMASHDTEKADLNRWMERAKEMLRHDNQLRTALMLTNAIDLALKNNTALVATRKQAILYLNDLALDARTLDIQEVTTNSTASQQ